MQHEEEQVQCGGDEVSTTEDSAIAGRQGLRSFLRLDQICSFPAIFKVDLESECTTAAGYHIQYIPGP
jgi:hypothetical protein